jgi:hypothetical protein
MYRLTKFSLAAAAVLAVCASPVFASSGIFGTGVVISSNVGGAPALDLFEMTLLGDSRHAPAIPGDGGESLGAPTLINTTDGSISTWADSSNPSLGTFDPFTGDTLTLDGGEMLTFKNGGSNVSGADMFYSINGGAFQDATLAFNQDNVNGSTGDQRWYSDTAADANLLSGLSNGTYTLAVYFRDSNSDDGNDYVSNGGNNFNATFTVVPEPSTDMMLLTSLVGGSFYLVRRRRY